MSGPLILPWRGKWPKIAPDAFIAPTATIIGDVEIGSLSSVWFGCILRADVNIMRIGARTNIQDGTIIHVDSGGYATLIGDDVLIGHKAMIHGTTIEDKGFIGMCATTMDGVVIESEAMVGAGALVSPGKRVGRRQLWAGTPARHMRDLTDEQLAGMARGVAAYAERGAEMRAQLESLK
jgi:carbonic anhydrase/acetyltransferase-like protein (isoleucine patch superfamily)